MAVGTSQCRMLGQVAASWQQQQPQLLYWLQAWHQGQWQQSLGALPPCPGPLSTQRTNQAQEAQQNHYCRAHWYDCSNAWQGNINNNHDGTTALLRGTDSTEHRESRHQGSACPLQGCPATIDWICWCCQCDSNSRSPGHPTAETSSADQDSAMKVASSTCCKPTHQSPCHPSSSQPRLSLARTPPARHGRTPCHCGARPPAPCRPTGKAHDSALWQLILHHQCTSSLSWCVFRACIPTPAG